MSSDGPSLKDTRQRHVGVIVGAVIAFVFLGIVASGFELPEDPSTFTDVAELSPGDCFQYPGDGVTDPARVRTVNCSEVHFAEVYGTTTAGDNDSCVGLFEAYTGVDNYWAFSTSMQHGCIATCMPTATSPDRSGAKGDRRTHERARDNPVESEG